MRRGGAVHYYDIRNAPSSPASSKSVWTLQAHDESVSSFDINPIIPGFHPDHNCIFVPEGDNTFFCASSDFNAFAGIPIHASKDLIHWRLVSNALNRPEQLCEETGSVGAGE